MIKGDQCHLLHGRLFMPIYAILFSPTVHLACFSRPGCEINRGGISVFFRIFFTNVNPTFRSKSCYSDCAQPLHEQNTSRQRKLEEEEATMSNEQATKWPPYF